MRGVFTQVTSQRWTNVGSTLGIFFPTLCQRWQATLSHRWMCTRIRHQANDIYNADPTSPDNDAPTLSANVGPTLGKSLIGNVVATLAGNVDSSMEVHAHTSSVQRYLQRWSNVARQRCSNDVCQRWSNVGQVIHGNVVATLAGNVDSSMEVHAHTSSVQRYLQRWSNVARQRCSNDAPTMGQRWFDVGMTLAPTLFQRWSNVIWQHCTSVFKTLAQCCNNAVPTLILCCYNVDPTLLQRWSNVAPTLFQHMAIINKMLIGFKVKFILTTLCPNP